MEIGEIAGLYEDGPSKRIVCETCERPERTCWCEYLPRPRIRLGKTRVVIIQHPNERKRQIRTAGMLAQGLAEGQCQIFVRRKVVSLDPLKAGISGDEKRLRTLLNKPNCYLLFPHDDAATTSDISSPENGEEIVVVALDGTWNEAKKLYSRSPPLKSLPKLIVKSGQKSGYVVKTQPNESCLSTVESVALALDELEKAGSRYFDALTQPLLALCSFQISHGAVKHDAKEFKRDVAGFEKQNNWRNRRL